MRRQAPELALAVGSQLTQRSTEFGSESDRIRALVMYVGASCRLGSGFEVTDQAVRALRWAQAIGANDLEHEVRVDLAGCARALDLAESAGGVLRPVLDADATPALRAAALVEAALCLGRANWRAELDSALSEADRLYSEDDDLDADSALLRRCMVRAEAAAQHRRHGDTRTAAEAVREGEHLLAELSDAKADNGAVGARLTLEWVLAMLDAGRPEEAVRSCEELLYAPVRATTAPAVNWLRFALARRVFQPSSRLGRARELLQDACASAERHRLYRVLADSRAALAEVDEAEEHHAEALVGVRAAQAARTELDRTSAQARRVVTGDFPPDEQQLNSLVGLLSRSSSQSRSRPAPQRQAAAQRQATESTPSEQPPAHTNGSARHTTNAAQETRRPAASSGGRRRKPEPENEDTPPAEPRNDATLDDATRQGNGRSSGFDWAGLPGMVVTEGSGGRRRAPDPDEAEAGAADGATKNDFELSGDGAPELETAAGSTAEERPAGDAEEPGSEVDIQHGLSVLDELSARLGDEPSTTEPPPAPEPVTTVEPVPDGDDDWPVPEPEQPSRRTGSATYEQTKSEVAKWLAALNRNAAESRAANEAPEPAERSEPADPLAELLNAPAPEPEPAERDVDAPIPLHRSGRSHRDHRSDRSDRPGKSEWEAGDGSPDSSADAGAASGGAGEMDASEMNASEDYRSALDGAAGDSGRSTDDLALGDLLTEAMLAFHSGSQPYEEDYASRYQEERDEPPGGQSAAATLGWPEEWLDPDGRRKDEPAADDAGYPASGEYSFSDDPPPAGGSGGSGGAHAGGRRPDTEWRFSERRFRSDYGG
jgi:hypothetical protein